MKVQMTKRAKIITAISVTVAILITAITCGIVFGTRKKLTTQEWLTVFGTSLESARNAKDGEGNAVPIHFVREIEIKEDGVTVAEFRQKLQIAVEDGEIKAYLSVEEKYPANGATPDDVCEEYYLSGNEMRARRKCGEEEQISRFESDIDIILTVAAENIGDVNYDFDEYNFLPVEEGAKIISHDGEKHSIVAMLAAEKYSKFFGEGANIEGLGDVKVQMQITGTVFDSLRIDFKQGDTYTAIKMIRYDIEPIGVPEWAQ